MTSLVVVESPAKAKTISRYLGKDFSVVASYGHVRDLPSKNGSVNPDDKFSMVWEVDARSKKHMDAIIKEARNADHIYLATDPDREGEAISWHIEQILRESKVLKGKSVERIVFHEITQSAVKKALAQPRAVNQDLVDAYLARRALDYLVGFNLSPVLWRKLPGSRSAGRVQSVALKLIVNREQEVEAFKSEEYWSIAGEFKTPKGADFLARLTHVNGTKIDKMSIQNEASAKAIVQSLGQHTYQITEIEKKQTRRNPTAPFITSTLQQEASRKLGFGASRTMQTAQKLYEGISLSGETTGLITYMRTDGVQLSADAVTSMRAYIGKVYGKDYVPAAPIVYKSKAKNAQEAHEAIRPTDINRTPEKMRPYLDDGQYKLYNLIWKRTMACQMTQAVFDQVSLFIASEDKKHQFKATGSTLVFDGFLRVYQEGVDDEKLEKDADERLLPPVHTNDPLGLLNILPKQHFTEPPPRFSEASLVKKLEELGIGRPSTYASIIQVLQDRSYVTVEKRVFFPTDRGRIVTSFLEHFFKNYVEYDFTAKLEDQLDDISAGALNWQKIMAAFWGPFHENVDATMKIDIVEVIQTLEKDMESYLFPNNPDHMCPKCSKGKLNLRLGKFGAFLGCAAYPECSYTKQVSDQNTALESGEGVQGDETKFVGTDPHTGNAIYLRKGPYGWYLQWENEFDVPTETLTPKGKSKKKPAEPKPKRAPLPAGAKPEAVTLEQALFLKTLPLFVGVFPETGEKMTVNIGRFGPYVKMGSIFASIPKNTALTDVDEPTAITLVQKKIEKMASAEVDGKVSRFKKKPAEPKAPPKKPIAKTTARKKPL